MKFIPFLILFSFQLSAIAQDMNKFNRLTNTADSLAKVNKWSKSEAIYLEAYKNFNQDPILQRKLAAVYLKMNRTKAADKIIKLAINNGADMVMLHADTSIKKYLDEHPNDTAIYSYLSKQYDSSVQIKDKNRWIDPYREKF